MTTTVGTARPVSVLVSFARVVMVAAASVLLGGLTFFAQGFLPGWFTSFANSASGWTVLTAVLIGVAALQPWVSMVSGAVSFVLLTLGYSWAAALSGLYYDPMLFSIIGILVGPFVGLAAAWLRARGLRAALATAALAGVGVGEGIYGLTVVAGSTSPVYWTVIGVAGVALLTIMLVRRIRGRMPVMCAVAGTVAIAAAFLLTYSSVGGA